MAQNILKCPLCKALTPEENVSEEKCPSCGTLVGPVNPAHSVSITLEWEQVRMLVNLALNSAQDLKDDPVFAENMGYILRVIRESRPSGAKALTLEEQFQEDLNNPEKVLEMLADLNAKESGAVDTSQAVELPNGKKVYYN